MKKVSLLLVMAFVMSPLLNAANYSFEELVVQTCFDQAEESTEDEEGTYEERHEAFLAAYDECMAE